MVSKVQNKTQSKTKPIWTLKVNSSSISKAKYDVAKKTLYLEFKSGQVYAYQNVRIKEFIAFTLAESQGKYFHEFIRDQKEGTQLQDQVQGDKYTVLVQMNNAVSTYGFKNLKSAAKEKLGSKAKGCIYKGNKQDQPIMVWSSKSWVFASEKLRAKYSSKL
jgi:hypothetical protein